MKKRIDTLNKRNSITLIDDIIYSQVEDNKGNSLNLQMSMLVHNVNVERKTIVTTANQIQMYPVILCIPGGGFTHCERNRILPELQFLAEEGYIIASIDYRLSLQSKFPAQIEDVNTAIRFLKANAKKYHIDINKIGVLGRSAGGCLSLMAGMNNKLWNKGIEWNEHSATVQAACSMYGITDISLWMKSEIESQYFSNAKSIIETVGGTYVGGSEKTIFDKAINASPIQYINENMAPLLMLHGDLDPIVPLNQSETFYKRIEEMKLEDKVDYYVVSKAGHGSKEFFQEEIREIILNHFNKNLKVKE